MLRSFFYYIFFIPFTLFMSVTAIISGLLGSQALGRWASLSWSQTLLAMAGTKLEADISAIDPNETYVFMCNHQSFYDIPLLIVLFRDRRLCFVAKESLFKIPVFGPCLKALGHVSIDRTNRRKSMKSIDEAVEKAKGGTDIVIFPEGTRQEAYDELGAFHIGGMILALRCGRPTAPIVMSGSGAVMPKGSLVIHPGLVRAKALSPIDTAGFTLKDRERFRDELHAVMNSAYQGLHTGNLHD